MYIRINCYLTVNSLTLLIGERTENRRFMSLCQEKDIFGTKQKILFLCQNKPIGPAALVSVNNCLLLFFLLLGVIQYDGYGVLYKATESRYWLLLRKPKRGGTAQQQPSPIGASPWRNEEVKSNIYLHTDYRLSADFVYYLPQISGIVAPILSA